MPLHTSSRRTPPALTLLGVLALAACGGSGGQGSQAPTPDGPGHERVRYEGDFHGGLQHAVDVTLSPGHAAEVEPVKASPDRLWSVLPTAYQENGIQVRMSDPTAKALGNRQLRLKGFLGKKRLSRFVDCGQSALGASADSYDVILSVVSSVAPGPTAGASELRTVVTGTASAPGNSGIQTRCTSTGALEKLLAGRARALGEGGSAPQE